MLHLLLLALLWGPSFVFIKLAAVELPLISLVTWRLSIAAIMLLTIIKIMKIPLPKSYKIWGHATIQGFFSSAMPFMLFGYSMLHIQSILGGCINGTVPLLTALIAHFCIKHEQLNTNKIIGITLGLSGFVTLLLPTILDGSIDADSWSLLACFGGSLCYAIGMVYARLFLHSLPKYTGPCMQISTSLLYMVPLTLLVDPTVHILELSTTTILSILGLSSLGTTFAFIVYFNVMNKYGATYLSMVAYLLPIAAAMFGFICLDEKPNQNFIISIGLVMAGLFFVNKKVKSS
ncbi:MAG: DMT family transporter [Francisellaceae bacterium]|jgi:drug/metabolite transporter (DMT)-like permease|nr:DMT family transporter [Francisellaceae bacterium]MBT6206392.1 DMT family transporter [Francisellaceae bacterium]MBT6538351.1 DMT family transporter [Francisellaceae bacterium]